MEGCHETNWERKILAFVSTGSVITQTITSLISRLRLTAKDIETSHWPQLESPDEFNLEVAEFLNSLSKGISQHEEL